MEDLNIDHLRTVKKMLLEIQICDIDTQSRTFQLYSNNTINEIEGETLIHCLKKTTYCFVIERSSHFRCEI